MKLPFGKKPYFAKAASRGASAAKGAVANPTAPASTGAIKANGVKKPVVEPYQSIKPNISDPAAMYEKKMHPSDIISPPEMETDFANLRIGDVYVRTLFVSGYPRFVNPGWMEPIINFNHSLDLSFYIYPVQSKSVLDELRRKITEMEAEIGTDIQRGKIVNPGTEAKLEDAKMLQEQLVKGSERFFEFSFYITIPAPNEEELDNITKLVESTLASILITAKTAALDMEKGFVSGGPFGRDTLLITRNMDTTSLATTFPFTTAELSGDTGILYGINAQNDSFVIFDRFELPNSNLTVFATSGAGKSLSYDEPVLYKDQLGQVNFQKIGDVVEWEMKNGRVQNLEDKTEGIVSPNLEVFSFNKELKGEWSKVKVAARKKSPKNLYKVKTSSGRELEITGDHCLVALKNGKVQTIKGKSAKVGDYIPLPRKVTQNSHASKFINTFELLQKSKIKYLRKNSGRVGNRLFKKTTSIPTIFPLTEDFFEILGFFAAEGMVNWNKASISNQDPEVTKRVRNYYKKLGLAHGILKNKRGQIKEVYVNSEAFREFLRLIGATGKAHAKKVPGLVFGIEDKKVRRFLRAYFEGDGGTEKHSISATTKSKEFASGLSYLLMRFGIIARVKETVKYASNTKRRRRNTYFRIVISGQENIKGFVNKIGFISKRKQGLAMKLTKNSNTNVDVIPELKEVFEDICKVLYSSSQIPAPKKFSEIKLGIFKPSRKILSELIVDIEKRVKEFEDLGQDGLMTLRELPNLEEIIQRGKLRKKNTELWSNLGGSWQTMKQGRPPFLQNALKAIEVTHEQEYTTSYVGGAIYRSFKQTGESLMKFDKNLWNRITQKNGNVSYKKVLEAKDFISLKYRMKKKALGRIKEKVEFLKLLANSDLFWDPITEIKKVRARHKHVYDLEVDNGVFLAGHAGAFVHNSFFVKLESARALMLGTQVIVIDPENEYEMLARAVGGEYIAFSFRSNAKINPFDLSQIYEEGENQLGLKILSLHSLFKIIMGDISPTQGAMLDRALINAYRAKGITPDPATQKREPPLIEDLYKALIGMEVKDALDLAARIEKYVKGSYVGIMDHHTNINITNPYTVFSVRDLEDALRPIAMFIIMDFIWTKVKRDIRRRLLVVDEAWHMMKYPDTAQFLYSIVKRARKYYLGLTTITQDVEDFLAQDIGKAIVTNSSMNLLLKQAPAAIDRIAEVFYLSQGERQLLLAAGIGEGILFAGPHHAPIRIVASKEEYDLVTTKPQDVAQKPAAGQNVSK